VDIPYAHPVGILSRKYRHRLKCLAEEVREHGNSYRKDKTASLDNIENERMSPLRNIAAYVSEHQQKGFYWMLHEDVDGAWVDIEASTGYFPLWLEAFDAGCVALFKLVDDERRGPRAAGPRTDASPVG
jgi:hypothetical protein